LILPKSFRLREVWVLGAFVLLCFAVAAVGGAVTATSVDDWYQSLAKPAFTPPDWLFAPVWTALYALMAIAAWRVWRKADAGQARGPMTVFALQLGLNLAWSVLFFGMNSIGAALLEICVLLGAIILTTILFARRDRLAGALFVPYALWVGYALLLNASIWVLNR
jgi:tryptophan-rich sensory protein